MPAWLTRLPSHPSTNAWALEHLAQRDHGDCVVTDCQTAGRGQAGRSWVSDAGVLTASWVLRLRNAGAGPALSLAAGLALVQAIEDLLLMPTGASGIAIKWPNDAYLHDRKLAGILCEARVLPSGAGLAVVVGIGCNVDPAWGDAPPPESHTDEVPPISLRALTAHPPAIDDLLPAIRTALLEAAGLVDADRFAVLLPALRQRNWLAGRHLRLVVDDGEIIALVEDLDDRGRLVVRLPDGGQRPLDSSACIRGLLKSQAFSLACGGSGAA